MATLVIHTPSTKSGPPGYRSFADTLREEKGQEYGLFRNVLDRIRPGMPVIVIDKQGRRQAEGKLLAWDLKYRERGVGHYDIAMEDLRVVPFQGASIKLNKRGVAII